MIEVAATALIVAVAMALTVQVLTVMASERRDLDRRRYATLEVANRMERLAGLPLDELEKAAASPEPLSPRCKEILTGAEFSSKVEAATSPPGRRIALSLRWRNRQGGWVSPVRLTSWVYPLGGVR